ncbi:MAG: Zn-ribbon domain-containing OB-fold protein [Dehalococcoidia bacterium]
MGEYTKPLPQPTPETKPFWDALKEHRLLIQRCKDCGRAYFYPRPLCPKCFSSNVEWFQASGKGKLYSFVINYRAPPGFEPEPYVIAVVELEEGPRMLSNLIGVEPDPEKVRCDMPLEIQYDDVTDEVTLAKFRPVQS